MIRDRLETCDVFDNPGDRWPKADDQLLTSGRDTYIVKDAGERSFRLLRGYKRAGDVLIQQALSDYADRDNLVFPALFNYRHYVELALKAIIERHGPFAGVALGKKDHKLQDLWQIFVKIATMFQADPTYPAAVIVAKCIGELAKIDAASTTFRYAKTLRGDVPALPEGIDLINLHDVMNGIENFFECAELDFQDKAERAAEHLQLCW